MEPLFALGVTVSGANDTGIFVEQVATGTTTIENDTVQNNGVNPNPKIGSLGGIVLAGVTGGVVETNTVQNNGGGGVFVNDNGPIDPGTASAGPVAPVTSANDNVENNTITGNYGSCGIVYATHNSGGTITGGSSWATRSPATSACSRPRVLTSVASCWRRPRPAPL